MQVREVMTDQVQCCAPDTNLAAAIEIMWDNDCGVVPVVEDGKLAGIVTDRDICIALGNRECAARDVALRDVGTTTVYTFEPESDVYAAMEIMQTAMVRHVPVVDRLGRLQGIVTLGDLTNRIEREDGSALNAELRRTLKAISAHRLRMLAARVAEMMSLTVAS